MTENLIKIVTSYKESGMTLFKVVGVLLSIFLYASLAFADLYYVKIHDRLLSQKVYTDVRWILNSLFKYVFLGVIDIVSVYMTPSVTFNALCTVYPVAIILGICLYFKKPIFLNDIRAVYSLLTATTILILFNRELPSQMSIKKIESLLTSNLYGLGVIFVLILAFTVVTLYTTRFNHSSCISCLFVGLKKSPFEGSDIFFVMLLLLLSLISAVVYIFIKMFVELGMALMAENRSNEIAPKHWALVAVALSLKLLSVFLFDIGIGLYKENYRKFIIDHYALNIAVSETIVFYFFGSNTLYSFNYTNLFSLAIVLCLLAVYVMNMGEGKEVTMPCFCACCKRKKKKDFLAYY